MASIREHTSRAGETTYAVLYRLDGRQRSVTFDTREAAARMQSLIGLVGVDKAFAALAVGSMTEPVLTVRELAERYLEWKARPGEVTARTLMDYRRDIDNWILPWLGHQAAEHVDETDVQRWVDHMATKLAPKSVFGRHMLLHSMYQFGKAKSRKLVTHNPCLETELPKRSKKPPKGTTIPEYLAILAAARRRNSYAADLITFLGETGWRFSEATALDVQQVEDDGEHVWVSVSQVFRLDDSYRQVLVAGQAKSWRSFRRIRLFPDSAAVVRAACAEKGPGQLVFTNSRGRPWNQNTFLRETWPRILSDAGLAGGADKPTPHWLRHMHVAVLGAAGAPIQEIQRRIGHESIQTTIDVYGGMIGDISTEALGRGAAIMAGRQAVPGLTPPRQGELESSATPVLIP